MNLKGLKKIQVCRKQIKKVRKILFSCSKLPYFFNDGMEVLRVQNNYKNLDTSSQMDLDLWDALEGKKIL